jgi:hypothetical protein
MFEGERRDSPMGFTGGGKKTDAVDRVLSRPAATALDRARKAGDGADKGLDSDEAIRLHGTLMSFYTRELERQGVNRAEMARDEAFYDNEQWDPQDAATLRDRGQVPLAYNVISTAVDWIIGTEKRGRTQYKILPRRKDSSKQAQRKTDLFKYLDDVNYAPFQRSRAFEDAVKVGLGWMECGAQEDDEGEPLFDQYESWRNILWDSASTDPALRDCRYLTRTKWLDLDLAQAMFPNRAGMLRLAAENGTEGYHGSDTIHGDEAMDSQEQSLDAHTGLTEIEAAPRRRVRVIEMWFRKPVMTKKIKGGEFAGEVYDDFSAGHREAVAAGNGRLIEKVTMRMHVAVMSINGLLFVAQSPYRHNDFPFTPIWAYRRGKDNLPYGVIRRLRDIQDDINKRASKALHILSSNKTIMDEGAVPDLEEFAEEVSRPDAIIVKRAGKELVINAERELAPAHMELMSRSIQMIQQVSGVTDEAMGRTTNATAGIAIQARQQQAGMATAALFDNLRLHYQVHGGKKLSVIEQFCSEEKAFRITNARGTPTYIQVNDGLPENDIVRSKADFVISEEDWRASVRQAQVAELMDLMAKIAPVAPQAVLVLLDLVVESMDIGNREEIVKRIRQLSGQRDPDAEELTAEEVAQMQEKQRQAQLQERGFMAEVLLKEAKAGLTQQQTQEVGAKINQIVATIAGTNVGAQKAALEAALLALSAPPAAQVGDLILHESGFQSRTEQEADARAQGIMQGEELQAAQREQEAAQAQQQQAQAEQEQAQQVAQQVAQAREQANPTERAAIDQAVAQQRGAGPMPA